MKGIIKIRKLKYYISTLNHYIWTNPKSELLIGLLLIVLGLTIST
ncbi:Uncharacterised protein [uncultured archaeon]|nr:Uncharacterised protein [uncultured archaeon]